MSPVGRKILFLANLGSPAEPTPQAVGPYLREFLMDHRVLDIPTILRWLLVNVAIVPRRKFRSAEAYQKVWTSAGSPLVATTGLFAEKLSHKLTEPFEVVWGMRYGTPSIRHELNRLSDSLTAQDHIYFVPLYPQYATSSTESSLDVLREWAVAKRQACSVFYLQDFYDADFFIQPLAANIERSRRAHSFDHILFSYHGLPERHLSKLPKGEYCLKPGCCDVIQDDNRLCYRAQAYRTTGRLAFHLGLKPSEYGVAFQSRLGRTPWIQPFTDEVLVDLARKGVRRLGVVCPSFVTDCLETLEEIQMAGRETFIQAGGLDLKLIPCLNDSADWVESFASAVRAGLSWQALFEKDLAR